MSGAPGASDAAKDELDLEAGRRLFAREAVFVLGVADMTQLPRDDLPEVAFAGRSNVGKSSLLNALTGRKSLARASNAPGRTRELNFFRLDDRIVLVDLPGYGYAKAPKKKIERWTRLTRDYLRGRANLKRVFLLIDARHGIRPADEEVMSALDAAAVSYQIVLTKLDKIAVTDHEKPIADAAATIIRRPAAHPRIIATSSTKGVGLDVLRAEIAALVERRHG